MSMYRKRGLSGYEIQILQNSREFRSKCYHFYFYKLWQIETCLRLYPKFVFNFFYRHCEEDLPTGFCCSRIESSSQFQWAEIFKLILRSVVPDVPTLILQGLLIQREKCVLLKNTYIKSLNNMICDSQDNIVLYRNYSIQQIY